MCVNNSTTRFVQEQEEYIMPLVLGTAGHIDHGKTSLVRALTGIDCDRLEEEKRRGITIELGFAHMPLADGERLGIVDVPGHERFVKNMVAGAAGIDFVMLIIAADEGVMPQTREHLEICSLLGIKHGFVALTKIDMVDAEWIDLVSEDVRAFLQGTFLQDAPIFPVSSMTRQGVDELREHVIGFVKNLDPSREGNLFRLPVDRIFTMKGHGTVITGTLIAGEVQVGDEAVFMPDEVNTKVRGLQWHNASADAAGAGQRCAINVQNIEVGEVERGSVLAHPNTLFPSTRWMVMLHCLSSAPRPLRARTEIHFHHGAREVAARLYFFDRDRLQPGESALTEIRFTTPMVGVWGDRCVVRAYSPLRTVAGGTVLHPIHTQLRRKDANFEERFSILCGLESVSSLDERVLGQLKLAGENGASFAELMVLCNANDKKLEKILQLLSSKGEILCFDKDERLWVHMQSVNALMEQCLQQATVFHERNPLKSGMSRGVLCPKQKAKLAHIIIERCLRNGTLTAENDILRLSTHKVELDSQKTDLREALLQAHVQAGFTPPNLKDVLEKLDVDTKKAAPMLKILVDEKLLVKVKDGLYYDAKIIDEIRSRVRAWFDNNDDLDPAGLKEILDGLSRKYLIAILEYMDRERITMRVGDKRQWRGKN